MKKLISYVLPIYNEQENIDLFHQTLIDEVKKLAAKYDFEFIYINDGSRDKSLDKLTYLHSQDKRVKVLDFSRNYGHQIAVTAGLDYSQGDAVIIMDTDLQDPPAASIELIGKWEQGFDVVYAQRHTRKDGFFKKTTAFIFYRLLGSLTDIKIPKDTGDFRLLDRKVVAALGRFKERNRFLRGMVSFVGFKQTAHLFDRHERYAGKTGYPLSKMVKFALDGITSFSTTPLKLITRFGFFVSFLSFIIMIYALYQRLANPQSTVSGWAMLVVAITFIGGVQMIMLGILGEYIGRIYIEVQSRPLYLVQKTLDTAKSEP